ncbi:terminase large subunit [Mycobacterium phage BrownCNA]|uniref:Terminase n=4 Tax=Caudoviricetes TaxID=2731619 RepID=A0A345KWG7_9CAUD|nr:terminase large subunit [Mycobacterium phage BrownCNA]YP_010109548.1 terminase large subunit [Mycobacterium phage Heath]AKY02718.1 terminase [Mycobacterium phage BrownCNA]AXH47369.1 terminase [Mycobacterium phage Hangman]QNJ56071.1 terminase large subunit [Mycobacterium phage Heath]
MAKRPELEFPENGSGDPAVDVWQSDGTFDSHKAETIFEETKNWPPEQRAAMLRSLRAAETRATVRTKYRHPAEMAAAVTPGYRITPALAMISTSIERVLNSHRKINLSVSMPPQEGKSSLCSVWAPLRALQLNPNRRIILATYAQPLADMHSRTAREVISTHGAGITDPLTGLAVEDKIGLRLAQGANKISFWSVEGGAGGLLAAGIGATITGMPADLLIIDDPFKNMMEADSATHRANVELWFSSVALTRLAPDASIILIQTRWHPEDLAGKVLAGEKLLDPSERTWRHLNIPAIAEEGIPDALGREPGTPMVSARDTPEAKRNFAQTRKQVGERTWYALYQGSPRNPAGGIFQRAWFDPRLPQPPSYPVASVVGIDPADSGEGDETGIICGALYHDGQAKVALTHDRSGMFTSDQWAREGVLLALEQGARVVAVEGYTAAKTYMRVVRQAYTAIHNEAVAKRQSGALLTPVEQRALTDIPPFQIKPWRGANKADAVARAGGLSQSLETGRCRTVEGSLAVFEEQACDWQMGQHQPDRVAAAIITHDILMEMAGAQMQIAAPVNRKTAPPPAWMRRHIGGK